MRRQEEGNVANIVEGLATIFMYMVAALAGVFLGLSLGGERLGVPLAIVLAFTLTGLAIALTIVRARRDRS